MRAALPADNIRPIKVFSQDESRFGLITIRRRRLTARGTKPVGSVQHVLQSFYVYGAVAPTTGDYFLRNYAHLNSTTFQEFLDEFARTFADSLNILVVDNGGCHTAKTLTIPANVRLVFVPPYSPEVNPIERLWQDMKAGLAWQHFTTLDEQEAYITAVLRTYDRSTLQSLTSYPFFVEASNAVCT